MKVYCVFKEEIIQMCYEVDTLDKIFDSLEKAEAYICEMKKYSNYKRTIEIMDME
jgi:hypothetical protein